MMGTFIARPTSVPQLQSAMTSDKRVHACMMHRPRRNQKQALELFQPERGNAVPFMLALTSLVYNVARESAASWEKMQLTHVRQHGA